MYTDYIICQGNCLTLFFLSNVIYNVKHNSLSNPIFLNLDVWHTGH